MNWALTFSQYYVNKLPTYRVFNLPTHFRSIILLTYEGKKADYTYIYIRDAHYSCVWSFFSFHFYLTQNETFAFLWLPCLVNDMVRIVLSSMKKSAIILMKFQLARINMYDVIFFFETEERPFFCGIIAQLLIPIPILVFLILHYFSIF